MTGQYKNLLVQYIYILEYFPVNFVDFPTFSLVLSMTASIINLNIIVIVTCAECIVIPSEWSYFCSNE